MRGFNVFLVDLPGQGNTWLDGLTFEPEAERAMGAVIDHLLARPGVDPDAVCAAGVSLGGYLVLRAAAHDDRLAAAVVSPPMPEVRSWLTDAVPLPLDRMPRWMVEAVFRLVTRANPQMGLAFSKWFARLGTDSFSGALEVLGPWTVDLSRVRTPVLCLLGEGEARTFHRQTQRAMAGLGDRAELRTTTVAEGADGHCQSNNFPVLQELVFDWLDEKLAATRPPRDRRAPLADQERS